SWLRKGMEVWFTALIELLWPKQRILEVYLNSVEWGSGIFGAEAAARHHFGVRAPYLSSRQASLLAAVLPNPRQWSAGKPSSHVHNRAAWIGQQVRQLGGSHYLQRLEADRPSWWPAWLCNNRTNGVTSAELPAMTCAASAQRNALGTPWRTLPNYRASSSQDP